MSAADAFTRATTSALSASFSVTGPLADLMYNVLPSTLSRVPATRWVGCCAHAVETANTAAKAAAVIIRIVLMSVLPMVCRAAEHTAVSPDGEEALRGVKFLNGRDRFVGHGGAPFDTRPFPASLPSVAGARPDHSITGPSNVFLSHRQNRRKSPFDHSPVRVLPSGSATAPDRPGDRAAPKA